jgi:parvulin-like peptidyl-prolyl isomerase
MKIFRAIFLVVVAVGGTAARAELASTVRVVVHDSVITSQEVEIPAAALTQSLRRQYANQPELLKKKFDEAVNDNEEQLIQRQLILHEFASAGYRPLPESYIDEQIEKRIQRDFSGDRTKMMKTLQAEGVTYEKFRQQQRERMILSALEEKNVQREILISPHKIETYYLAHKDEYKVDEQIKLRTIVLNTPSPASVEAEKKKADEIIRSIKGGASFAEMADVYSQSKGPPGGDRGWVQKYSADGALVLRKELAEVAFSLKPGELSNAVETPDALYLLMVDDRRPAHIKTLSEVHEVIESELQRQERSRLLKQWIERLKKKTFVRHF